MTPTPGEPPATHIEHSAGIQIGSGNRQTIHHHHAPAAPAAPQWPVRVGTVPLEADCYQDRDAAGLDPSRTTVVAGMGGVGKTQLAARHVRPLWQDTAVDLAVWINAADRDAILTGYAQAARAVGHDPGNDPVTAAQALVNWLTTTRRQWVVVLDDVQDPKHVTDLWPPRSATGHTVVTTRRRDAALHRADRHVVEVAPYSAAESLSYLRAKLASRPDLLDGAAELAEALGHLPLALAQAVAYVLDMEIGCAEYLSRFRTGRDVVPDRLPDDHQRTVDRTWELSVERADELTPAGVARPLLALLSFLDPNGIPAALVTSTAVATYLTERTGRGITSDDAERAVRSLRRLSLVTIDKADPARGIRVHALVQHATRANMATGEDAGIVPGIANALVEIWTDLGSETARAQSLRANAAELVAYGGAYLARVGHPVVFVLGHSLKNAGLAQSAAAYFLQVCEIAEDHLGPDHPTTLGAAHHLAQALGDMGDAAAAADAFEEVHADKLRVLGPDHQGTLSARHELARWRGEAGDAATALAELERLLPDLVRVLGPDHQDTFVARHEIARWRGETRDAAGAVAEFERLLADQVRVLGADHPDTLSARYELAAWRGHAGDVLGTVAEFERLLADRLRVLGADHPDTLSARHELAYWRQRSGDAAGAVREFESLLAHQERVLGPIHPDTVLTRANFAAARGALGDVAAAVEGLTQAFAQRVRMHGADHPHAVDTRRVLAFYRYLSGDKRGALDDMERLVKRLTRVRGANDPLTREIKGNLAQLRRQP